MSGGYYMPKEFDDDDGAADTLSKLGNKVRDCLPEGKLMPNIMIKVARSVRAVDREFEQRTVDKHMAGQTSAHIAKKASDKRYMATVDAFLSDTSSTFAKIVPARTVVAETRRRRGR